MLYHPKAKTLQGLDGAPIKERAVATVRRYQRQALRNLTSGERGFCKLIAPVCAKCRGVRYVKQPIMYVTAGISFRLDFLFRDFKLAVEIDGKNHCGGDQKEADAWRDRVLFEARGIRTVRFTNRDVEERYLWVRAETVDALLAGPSGHKRELAIFAKQVRAHPDYARQEACEA